MIAMGLSQGDKVIVQGFNQVSDGTMVQIKNK